MRSVAENHTLLRRTPSAVLGYPLAGRRHCGYFSRAGAAEGSPNDNGASLS